MVPYQGSLQDITEILEEMPAIGDLDGAWCAFPPPFGILLGAISTDDPRMRTKPGGEVLRGRPVQQIDGTVPFEVDEDCAVAASLPSCPIVHAEDSNLKWIWIRGESNQPTKARRAAGGFEHVGQSGTGFASQRKPNVLERLTESIGAANPWAGKSGDAFAENPSRTPSVPTDKSSQRQLKGLARPHWRHPTAGGGSWLGRMCGAERARHPHRTTASARARSRCGILG